MKSVPDLLLYKVPVKFENDPTNTIGSSVWGCPFLWYHFPALFLFFSDLFQNFIICSISPAQHFSSYHINKINAYGGGPIPKLYVFLIWAIQLICLLWKVRMLISILTFTERKKNHVFILFQKNEIRIISLQDPLISRWIFLCSKRHFQFFIPCSKQTLFSLTQCNL